MATPPHASAAASAEKKLSFDAPNSEVAYARDVMRADGLTSIERSEREAALDENRREEAAIFERAASRLRPSWAGADEMLELGLAHAAPGRAVPEVVQPASFADVPSAPASYPAVPPSFAAAPMAVGSARDAGYASSSEDTDSFSTSGATRGVASRLAPHKLAIAAAGCVALGGLWAALSGDVPSATGAAAATSATAARAPAAVAPAAARVVAAPVPAAVTPAAATPAAATSAPAPVKSGELTRDEARALLGLPPEPAKAPAKKPATKAPIKAKAPLAKAAAKKPVARGVIPKNPFGPAKKPTTKR